MKRLVYSLLCLLCLLLCACGQSPAQPAPTAAPEPAATPAPTPAPMVAPTPEPTPEPTPAPEPLRVKLTIAGDVVLHTTLYDDALQPDGSYDFSYLFRDVEHYIQEADYATCCFEGALCGEGISFSGYPLFRAPDGLAQTLKDVGFDLVALASNHGMDGGKAGLDRTIDVMEAVGLDHVGSFRSQEERDADHGVLLKEINGIRIAFLNYTYGTNGIPVEKYPYAMNIYYEDYQTAFNHIRRELLAEDMAYAKSLEPDLIAVLMHWGAEYNWRRQPRQTEAAEYLFSLGADLVLGGHPHVPQPMEMVELQQPDGSSRTGYLCYCLGNLVGHMRETTRLNSSLSAMVQIEIEKDPVTGETSLQRVEYIPMATVDLLDHWIKADWRFRLLDLRAVLDDYAAGDARGFMNEQLYRDLSARLERIEDIMGPELVYCAAPAEQETEYEIDAD